MRKNIGKKGRLLRLAIALVLFAYAVWSPSWVALILGLFIFFEALFSWCALNQIMGRSSCDW